MKIRTYKKKTKKIFHVGNVIYDTITNSCTILAVVNSVKVSKHGSITMNVGTLNALHLADGSPCHLDLSKARYRLATQKEKERYFLLMYNQF